MLQARYREEFRDGIRAMDEIVEIDGSLGEGGGQILRSALSLSLVTERPFRMVNVRALRRRPGLLRQHLTSVEAAAQVGGAVVEGAKLGSAELTFRPRRVSPGDYSFSVGTAGSATLVLQTVLPALLCAETPSRLTLEGGTHNPLAPPFPFLRTTFLPVLELMGPGLSTELQEAGFYPAGGGRFHVTVKPVAKLTPLELFERGELRSLHARAIVANLPAHIAEREIATVTGAFPGQSIAGRVDVAQSKGPGNVLVVEVESENITETIVGFGRPGRKAEAVALDVVRSLRRYLASPVPVGRHLADQLLLPCALAGGGAFRTLEPTRHTRTNAEIIRKFIAVDVTFEEKAKDDWLVKVGKETWEGWKRRPDLD